MKWYKNIWLHKTHEHAYMAGVLNPHMEVEFHHNAIFIHSVMTEHDKGVWLFCFDGMWYNADYGYTTFAIVYNDIKASM